MPFAIRISKTVKPLQGRWTITWLLSNRSHDVTILPEGEYFRMHNKNYRINKLFTAQIWTGIMYNIGAHIQCDESIKIT